MRSKIVVLCVLLIAVSSFAQTDWQNLLKEDAVKIVGNKMVMESFYLLSFTDEEGNPSSAQYRDYSEAPMTGFISRDNFVGVSSMLSTMFILGMMSEISVNFEQIAEPIGEVDLEYKLIMASQGIQSQVINHNDGTTTRDTIKWETLFAK